MLLRKNPKIQIIVSILRRDGHYLNQKEINQPMVGAANEQTFLHRAVQLGAIDMVEELVNRRANPNCVTTKSALDSFYSSILFDISDATDTTPVHLACKFMKSHRRYVEIFKCLVRQGGDLRKVNWQSKTPLDLIESRQLQREILRFLKTCPKNNSNQFGIQQAEALLEFVEFLFVVGTWVLLYLENRTN